MIVVAVVMLETIRSVGLVPDAGRAVQQQAPAVVLDAGRRVVTVSITAKK